MTARSLRRALLRFAVLPAAGVALVVGFADAASAQARPAAVLQAEGSSTEGEDKAAEGEEKAAEGEDAGHSEDGGKEEGHSEEPVVAPKITEVDGNDTGYAVAGGVGVVSLLGVAAAIVSDRKRGGGAAGGAHH